MKKLKHYLTASLGLILFVSAIAFSLPQTGHSSLPPDKDVKVINTSAEAIPVVAQGTTNVAVQNVPTVKAQQNGAWNVAIAGTPTVEVGNNTANPVFVRDVDRPTAQPFLKEVTVTVPPGFGGENADLEIPVGKLVVIEQVSVYGTSPANEVIQQFAIANRVPPDNVYRPHYLQFTKQEIQPGLNAYTVGSQQVRIYAGPGSFARVARIGNTTVSFRFIISGYFVDE